jgi:hypothetical protein
MEKHTAHNSSNIGSNPIKSYFIKKISDTPMV